MEPTDVQEETVKDSADAVETDELVEDALLVEEELLVEEISIDGMCGVY